MAALETYLDDSYESMVAPASHAAVVTPDNDNDLEYVARSLLINVAGNLKITTYGGETVTIPVLAGVLPIMVKRVWATGTTATGITALY